MQALSMNKSNLKVKVCHCYKSDLLIVNIKVIGIWMKRILSIFFLKKVIPADISPLLWIEQLNLKQNGRKPQKI